MFLVVDSTRVVPSSEDIPSNAVVRKPRRAQQLLHQRSERNDVLKSRQASIPHFSFEASHISEAECPPLTDTHWCELMQDIKIIVEDVIVCSTYVFCCRLANVSLHSTETEETKDHVVPPS